MALGACDPAVDAPPTEVAASGTPSDASASATPPTSVSPAIEKRTVTKTRKIAFKTRKVNDSTLARAKRE